MQSIAEYIEQAIVNWGALGVFVGSILEEIIVPIPSSLVQAGAGFFFLSGQALSFGAVLKLIFWIAFPAAFGVLIGSLLIYFLTYYGGMPFIRKFGKYFMLNPEKVEETRQRIVARPNTVLVITMLRFIPLLPNAFVTAAAGLLRIPFWKYVVSTFVGVFIRALYLGIIGWATGSATGATEKSLYAKIAILVGVLALISVITTVIIRQSNRKNKGLAGK